MSQIFVFSVSSVRWCICFTSVPSYVCFIWAAWDILKRRGVFRTDDHRRNDRYLLYVYLEIFRPDPEPGGAVQLAAVGFGVRGKGVLDHGPGARSWPTRPNAVELDRGAGRDRVSQTSGSAYVPGEWVLQGRFLPCKSDEKRWRSSVRPVPERARFLSLICRNYEFQKGEILIDGVDIRKIKIASLRKHFGQMLQDVFLFSGTIRSNIRPSGGGYFRRSRSRQVCQLRQCGSFYQPAGTRAG